MGTRDMKMQITVGLRNRATAGLRAMQGEVRNFSAGLTGSLGGSSRGLGAVAGGLDKLGGIATAIAPGLGLPLMVLNTGLKSALGIVSMVGSGAKSLFGGIVAGARAAGSAVASIGKRAIVLGAIGAAGVAAVAKTSLDAAMQMENFTAKLTTATKSEGQGKQWLAWATKFAADTPFQINEVVDSATRLLLQGFNPATLLTNIGNMAGAMNKPMTDAVEAYLDGLRGEWERLKEFGITGANLIQFGAKPGATGVGVDTQSTDGAARAKKSLDALMQSRYGGGMAQMMKTAAGQISNLQDGLFRLKVTVGNLLLPVLKSAVTWGQQFVESLAGFGVGEKVGAWIAGIAQGLLRFGQTLAWIVATVARGGDISDTLKRFVPEGLALGIERLVGSFRMLGVAIAGSFAGIVSGADPTAFVQGIINGLASALDFLTVNVFGPGKLQGIWNWLSGLFVVVTKYLGKVLAFVTGNFTALGQWFRYVADYIAYLVAQAYKHLPDLLDVVVGVFGGIVDAMLVAEKVWTGVATGFQVVGDVIAGAFIGLFTVVTGVVTGLVGVVTLQMKALNAISFGAFDSWIKPLENARDTLYNITDLLGKGTGDLFRKAGKDAWAGRDKQTENQATADKWRATTQASNAWAKDVRKQWRDVPEPIAPKQPIVKFDAFPKFSTPTPTPTPTVNVNQQATGWHLPKLEMPKPNLGSAYTTPPPAYAEGGVNRERGKQQDVTGWQVPKLEVPKPTIPAPQTGAAYSAPAPAISGAGVNRGGGDTYSTTINVPITLPPGSNVDAKALAREVADEVEKRQSSGYMNQHRRAAAKLGAVPA